MDFDSQWECKVGWKMEGAMKDLLETCMPEGKWIVILEEEMQW